MDSRVRQLLTTIIHDYVEPREEKAAELDNPAAHAVGEDSPTETAVAAGARERALALEDPFEAALKMAARHPAAELRLRSDDGVQSRMADALIQFLVRPGLATVRTEEPAPEQYVYGVQIDWAKLRQVATTAGVNLDEALGRA